MKKITIVISILMAAALAYLASRYCYMQTIKLVPAEQISYLVKAADNFLMYGFLICVISWIWVNIAAVKTAQLFWLFIPLIFTIAVALLMSYHQEDLFLFRKQHGMWKGGFSLSYLFCIVIIAIAVVVISINYFILLRVTERNERYNE